LEDSGTLIKSLISELIEFNDFF